MNIDLIAADVSLKPVIQNLARFYVYELSKYDTNDNRSAIPENGLYEAYDKYFHFDDYWNDPTRFPFIIRVNKELAGFVLINKEGTVPKVDWCMAEFFIISKFQGKGVGREVALKILNKFSGIWEIRQMLLNKPAINFWHSIVNAYTKGNFNKSVQTISYPEPHDMIVLTFMSN